MASSVVSNQLTDSPLPIKNKGGRPTKAQTEAKRAAQLAEQSKPVGDPDFWVWLAGITPDEWRYRIGYLWRIEPITDRRMGGKATSIAKYARPFDLDSIMREHGSGAYRIDMCEVLPNGTGSKRLRQEWFTIMNLDWPPQVPLGDWINDPANEVWKWSEPKLRAQQEEPPEREEISAPDPNALFSTILDGVRTLRGDSSDNGTLAAAVLQMAQNNQEKLMELNDPAKQLTTLTSLLAILRPAQTEDTGLKLLIDMLREDNRAMRDEIKEMRREQNKPRNLIEEVQQFLPALKELNSQMGFSKHAAETGTDWGKVIEGVFEKVSDNLPVIMGMFARSSAPGQGMPAGWPSGAPPHTPALGAAPPITHSTSPAPAEELPPGVTPQQYEEEKTRMTGLLAKYGMLIMEVAPFMVDHFQTTTGYDFRDWFVARKGTDLWTSLRNEAGAERLTALAQLHPVMKEKLAPPEKLMGFLSEFFTTPGEEPEGYEDGAPDQNDPPHASMAGGKPS